MARKKVKRGAAPRRAADAGGKMNQMSMDTKKTRASYEAREIAQPATQRSEVIAKNAAGLKALQAKYKPIRSQQTTDGNRK